MPKPQLVKNGLEWTVFALSLALVVAVVATAMRGTGIADDGPPRLRVELGPPAATEDGQMRVPVALVHDGGQTVESVEVEVTSGTQTVGLTFGLVPRGTRRAAVAVFNAPAEPPRARIVGYALP